MDELRFRCRTMRRVALFAALNCSIITASAVLDNGSNQCWAADGDAAAESVDDLRSLLKNGWQDGSPDTLLGEPIPEIELFEPTEAPVVTKTRPTTTAKSASAHVERRRLVPIRIDAAAPIISLAEANRQQSQQEGQTQTPPEQTSAPSGSSSDPEKLPAESLADLDSTSASAMKAEESTAIEVVAKDDIAPLPRPTSALGPELPTDTAEDLQSTWAALKSEALRGVARDRGFGLFSSSQPKPTASLESVETQTPNVAKTPIASTPAATDRAANVPEGKTASQMDTRIEPLPAPVLRLENQPKTSPLPASSSTLVTVHATKLRDVASVQLQEASTRLQRGATHSAKRLTFKALRNIAAMQDVHEGGNRHAKQLETAFAALRESGDFVGKFGAVQSDAMARMVAVHETEILKSQDLNNLSSIRAAELYLGVAHQNLVHAVGAVRAASDALILLGQIEHNMAEVSDTHAGAVAVTLQRAAVEIDPNNATALYQLGSSMLNQGMDQQAFSVLQKSVNARPTRQGYQRLMQVAERLGDSKTTQQCNSALRDSRLMNTTPVRQLDPDAFAATYRPENLDARNAKSPGRNATSEKQTKAQPVSARATTVDRIRSMLSPMRR
ncbi:MAG: hypothetical protein HKN47_12505 [Pirellulaceae bacterium]|nr:hypothetical protein [Pirellulaceae bacterium]